MAASKRRRKHDVAEDVGEQLLLSFGLLESLLPIGGGEVEQALVGPATDEAEQVAEVAKELDAVQAGASQE